MNLHRTAFEFKHFTPTYLKSGKVAVDTREVLGEAAVCTWEVRRQCALGR